ncbi:hypothetical protein GF367_02870 [Candidatus Woesearchaeota archaeon]|nr:hypothetical protein [Candidatus Woesearchaeota archaeon]
MGKKRWHSLKAQATLFFILGIVLLAVFSFALYAKSLIVTEEMRREAAAILTDAVQTNSINYYVGGCLEQVTDDALYQLGRQGGRLDFTNDQPWKDYYVLREGGNDTNISYAIKPNTRCDRVVSLEPPYYPVHDTAISDYTQQFKTLGDEQCKYVKDAGFVGMNTLLRLCYQYGENNRTSSAGQTFACDPLYTIRTENNMQSRLQDHISAQMQECVDFSVFTDILGHNITVSDDEVDTTIIYAKDAVIAVATYPFTVKVRGRRVKVEKDFTYTSPVKLHDLYAFLIDVLSQESQRPDYNLERAYKATATWALYHDDWNVTFLHPLCGASEPMTCPDNPDDDDYASYDYVMRVEDMDVRINNESYIFQVAIDNRRPVLDYYHTGKDYYYDLMTTYNQTVILSPQGYDPDDTSISYWYEGWKETEDATFDFSCFDDGGDAESCVEREMDVHPQNWSNSSLYKSTGREAQLANLARDDTGGHNVTVYISDESGLLDWQVINILIFDLPVAMANGTNNIPDIDDRHASVEDPYVLDATASITSKILDQPLSWYDWGATADSGELFHVTFTSDNTENPASVMIPYEVDEDDGLWRPVTFYNYTDGEVQPNDITRRHFTINSPLNLGGTDVTLTLHVSPGSPHETTWSEPSFLKVTMHQCLPVRDTGHKPYPYFTENAQRSYAFDHPCCGNETEDWGTILTDNPCYTIIEYGRPAAFTDQDWFGTPPITPPNIDKTYFVDGNYITEYEFNNSFDLQNDVFKRTYTRYCDGNRGNTCTGRVEEVYERVADCSDELQGKQQYRCEGPSSLVFSETPLSCIDYDYDVRCSFEYSLGDIQTKTCDPTWRCATLLTNTYDPAAADDGDHLCQGGCMNGDCTYAVNCACSTDCGAECVPQTPPEAIYDDSEDRCLTRCNAFDCGYQLRQVCPDFCILSSSKASGSHPYANCDTYTLGDARRYCHSSPTCTSDKGCRLQEVDEMRYNHCDVCDENGYTPGDYCPAPGTVQDGTCYFGDRACTGSSCNLVYEPFLSRDCTAGEMFEGRLTCTAEGVQCCVHNNHICFATYSTP